MVPPLKRSDNAARRIKRDIGLVLVGLTLGCVTTNLLQGSGGEALCVTLGLDSSSASMTTPTTSDSTTNRVDRNPVFVPPGMNPIYSYAGKFDLMSDGIPTKWWVETSPTSHRTKQHHGDWFGQHGQDVAVAKFHNFKRNGFFVDLASNDAVWASNTFSLEQNFGWNGICIEANPQYWYRLSFRNCHVVGAIVGGATNQKVDVVLGAAHEGPYGGIVGKDFDNQKKKEAEPRYTIALQTVLEMWNAPKVIDYLSLDVEGAETFIMREFPFDKYRFQTMTVERPKDELKELFIKNGYKHVLDFKRGGGDTLWAHESVFEEGKKRTQVDPEDIRSHSIKGDIPGYS